jgi:hypothetical protein
MPKIEKEERPLSQLLEAFAALARAGGTDDILVQADDLARMAYRARAQEAEMKALREMSVSSGV